MIHRLADVQSAAIGKNTKIWQYVVVLDGARIGDDCNICSHVFIESDVSIGNKVTIKSGVQIWNGITIEDHVFIGPNVTFTNDRYPQVGNDPNNYLLTHVCQGVSIGGGATILPGITIGSGAVVGAGAVVVKDVAPKTLVVGVPATEIVRLTGE